MSENELDREVPYGEHLESAEGARAWARAADEKRPWRRAFREHIAELVAAAESRRVLELGGGPGQLAHVLLARCPAVHDYVLVDFSAPMLALAREQLAGVEVARFVQGDFRGDVWVAEASPPFDAIVAMQSVHEVRHKRHVPALYARLRQLAAPGALLLVCDHTPRHAGWPAAALFMTEAEQLSALAGAGFEGAAVLRSEQGLVLYCAYGR